MRVGAGKEDEDTGPYFLQTEERHLTRAHFKQLHEGPLSACQRLGGQGIRTVPQGYLGRSRICTNALVLQQADKI